MTEFTDVEPAKREQADPRAPGTSHSPGSGDGGPPAGVEVSRLRAARLGQRVGHLVALQRLAGNAAVSRAIAATRTPLPGPCACGTCDACQSEAKGDLAAANLPPVVCTAHAAYDSPGFDLSVLTTASVKDKPDTTRVKGTVTVKYKVNVTIDPATPPDGLSACATQKYADAIRTVLMPHERDHKTRYEKFNGSEQIKVDEETTDPAALMTRISADIQKKWQDRQNTVNADATSIDPFSRIVDVSACKAVTKDEEDQQKKEEEEKKKAAAKKSSTSPGDDEPAVEE